MGVKQEKPSNEIQSLYLADINHKLSSSSDGSLLSMSISSESRQQYFWLGGFPGIT